MSEQENSKDVTQEVTNSLSSVIASLGGYGLGTAFGSTQVSQADTLFKNNRWYLVSNIRQVLSELYVEHGIVRTLVDLPVDDAFRGGLEIVCDEMDQEDLEDLNYRLDVPPCIGHCQSDRLSRWICGNRSLPREKSRRLR